ncbi:hypothetical protein [Chryseobacterium lactis]|nr:hypothetical protein [Chryseobacterium lactis]
MNTISQYFKTIFVCSIVAGTGKFYSQVGINNTNPQATFDISGAPTDSGKIDGVIAPRITGTQLKSKDNLYTAAQDGTIVYITQPLLPADTSAKTTNLLEKGYYNFDASRGTDGEWMRMFHRYPAIAAGATSGSANTGNAMTLTSANSSNGTATMISKSFTLDKPALVMFTFSVPITNVTLANGTGLSGGSSKLLATNVFLTGPGYNNYLIVRSGSSIVNANTGAYTNSGYQVNGTRSLVLQPGTYTANLNPLVFAQDASGVRAVFGDNSYADTVFDIVALPMP